MLPTPKSSNIGSISQDHPSMQERPMVNMLRNSSIYLVIFTSVVGITKDMN